MYLLRCTCLPATLDVIARSGMPLSVGVGLAPTRELEDGYPSVSGFAGGGEPDPYGGMRDPSRKWIVPCVFLPTHPRKACLYVTFESACQCIFDEKNEVGGQRVLSTSYVVITFPTAPSRTWQARFPCTKALQNGLFHSHRSLCSSEQTCGPETHSWSASPCSWLSQPQTTTAPL